MAHLNKLAIRGIRSFDDKQISVIEFFSPVTVIVGHNGSGKTTIIECLKYATTGDQPPNTRGGAFVHDPKMANEKEVKAQVKLRFHAANGTRMLAVRNLSVTVKKGGSLTMKTLESILALADTNTEKGGKRGVISTKCAEMDAEIPHLLGVSKSVLDNVIFCHQEDSYWPLSEPSTLKKKFDDIFEATRYTKALDAIKALRKDRVAELKAENERLESLKREKTHSDKLKERIGDLNATIASKEVEYESTMAAHDKLVAANKKFYDLSHKFRETYLKIENLGKVKVRYQEELATAKENLQEIEGTDQELEERLANFGQHIQQQKEKRRKEENNRQDLEEDIADRRKTHVSLSQEIGRLEGEEKNQEGRIQEREGLIRDISTKYGIKGYEHAPLEREQVLEFISRIGDLQRKQNAETERAQNENRAKDDEYTLKSRQLHTTLDGYKHQKETLRSQIVTLQSSILDAERKVDGSQTLTGDLRTLRADMEEKRTRLEKVKADLQTAGYEERIAERGTRARQMEEQREALNAEIRALSLQADARARLDIKRTELKNKTGEVQNTLEINNAKYKKLVGADARPETMERDLEKVVIDKDREQSELDSQSTAANRDLQLAENTLSHLKVQLKTKQQELKGHEKKLRDSLEGTTTLSAAIKEATDELTLRTEESSNLAGASQVYEFFLKNGKAKKTCMACNRHLDDGEMKFFEKYLKDQMKKTSPEKLASNKEEMLEWDSELKRLQTLLPVEASLERLKTEEIPGLERQIKDHEGTIPDLSRKAEQALEKLRDMQQQLKDLSSMKQHAIVITRTLKDVERLKKEISGIETDLAATGSMKTADDVQGELDSISSDLRTNERERQALITERDRQNNVLRGHEHDIHSMQLQESGLQNELRERERLEERIETMRKEVVDGNAKLKELDVKISEAHAPIERLDQEHRQMQSELDAKLAQAQTLSQEINISVDKLDHINRAIEKYVRDKRGRRLNDCRERSENLEVEIKELNLKLEGVRETIAEIDKEINEGGASVASLRENLRVRKLAADIAATQAEIDSYDIEAAAKAQRNFEDKYSAEKKKENDMQAKFAHIGGELSSHKAQLKTLETDLKEFKDVQKKYTDQLIKVKMSDMANSDLEKYAKALDNAIMKYHSLKMEEVNDNMRHLWNKTYQGTDIDGIKIRYDAEGGASKRSYNYRVVMTKDQVEMDMRGRCSAGQKMLASIIIRLALSDSFGQNCGILALDEPTNALDVENIDALAASLIDIINERKNHSNFQLIIITHDENFLRKLGQSEVMEYYWRVSRDSRQKSVIERQRFR